MKYYHSWMLVCSSLIWLGCHSGCAKEPAKAAPLPPQRVTVSQPIEREVTDFVDFTGRTEAPFAVDIRARVTGYIEQAPFREGSEVKTGTLLYLIDQRPYQASLDQAQADLVINEARAALAKSNNARAKETAKINPGAISAKELDQYQAAEDESKGAVLSSLASVETAKINLAFCTVTSPIDGRVSRYYYNIGNLVNQDTTLLTTVVSEDPIYAYFDVDENTMLFLVRKMLKTKNDLLKEHKIPVYMGLSDEKSDTFPHQGYIDFANNVVDSSTGTIRVRGVFPNPASEAGRRLLRPGMFVRIRLPTGDPDDALLVAEKALGTDQGKKFLYLVIKQDGKDIVKYQAVTVGALQDDGTRVVETGLKAGQWVITSGLQLVQPGKEVTPEQQPMLPSPVTTAKDSDVTEADDRAVKDAAVEKAEEAGASPKPADTPPVPGSTGESPGETSPGKAAPGKAGG